MRIWLSEDWRTCCSSARLSGPMSSSPPAWMTAWHGVSADRQLCLGKLFTKCQLSASSTDLLCICTTYAAKLGAMLSRLEAHRARWRMRDAEPLQLMRLRRYPGHAAFQ